MSGISSLPNAENNTSKSFAAALVTNTVLLALEVGIFVILKHKLWRIYSPRTYLPPPDKRAPELPSGPWKWLPSLVVSPDKDIIHKNGLDAYMLLRFLQMLIWIFLVFTLLTFAVIIPVNAINVTGSMNGLERISWTNITSFQDQPRYAAHIIVVYVLTFFVLYMIRREMHHFVELRHDFLLSKSHSRLPQARTVLITTVPDDLANEHDLRTFASFVPGGVDKVWLYRDTKDLNEHFQARQEACEMLEAALATILTTATKNWRKRVKTHRKAVKSRKDEENGLISFEPPPASREFLNELVSQENRPKHRTGTLGLWGSKVDTIDWCKAEISRLNIELKERREHTVKGKFLGSAFIRCNLQIGAHVLAQCVAHHKPLAMHDKWMETNPKDIVWQNLDDGALEMTSRYALSWAALVGLIIIWAFPVSFIGTLSNLNDLCVKVSWLRWVCRAPDAVQGIIQGVLPPILLAALFALLPYILQGLAWYECIPRYSLISISVYRRFFIFLLIHGFLIVTLSSGITRAIQDIIENPTHTVQQLANQLPGASVFFLTYMVTQGLAGAGSALAQIVPLVLHYVRKWLLGRTPRQAYNVTFLMPSADFGVILPRLSLLATVAFAYSVLSPLINLLAFMSYIMYYFAWKFLLTHVFDQPDEVETGGLFFPMAIGNLVVGLYIEQISLACLFLLKSSVNGAATAIAEGALMIVLIAITGFNHAYCNKSFDRIIAYLPMSLATKDLANEFKNHNNKVSDQCDPDEFDLFSKRGIQTIRQRVKATTKAVDNTLDNLKNRIIQRDEEDVQDDDIRGYSEVDVGESSALAELTSLSRKESQASDMSDLSNSSMTSKAQSRKTPMIDPAAPALRSMADLASNKEIENDKHAFDHPSTYVEQAWIWIPKDYLGLSEVLIRELEEAGVEASDIGAVMDEKGIVEVTRNPPDEDWKGGHDV
ncbi:hypothetical protein AMATHDRAFT_57827 [Amanita thiersii Skay4041]|uniref:DUF221-domain-containing protein n=1 Tax=Amanita thiersii Skay4041 TaxID=703135 RepID=A0A2A9NND2_9AGAR|nr:hypothetical protein AMATHDRAFT_57827 [Amanita thiersii Skay4041]